MGYHKICERIHTFFPQIAILFRKIDADALVGFGGFSTFGPALAARTCGMPFHIHESNRIAGKAVRFLANRASHVYLPQGISLPGIPTEKFHTSAIH